MNQYLIVCRSVTQAQRAGRLLTSAGITNRVFRSPVGLTERGCSYSVKVRESSFWRALALLRQEGIHPVKAVRMEGGVYAEVPLV